MEKNYVDSIQSAFDDTKKIVKPSHYLDNSWDFIKQVCKRLPGDEAFNAGNAMKYIIRYNDKCQQLKDITKAIDYLNDLYKVVEERLGK